jgi:hypothetical protein
MGGGDVAGSTDSPSNFRRRVNDLVLSGVLEEVSGGGRSTDSDRPGRPPRMFRFSEPAWLAWLLRRSGTSTPAGDAETPRMHAHRSMPWLESRASAMPIGESAFRREMDDSRLFIELSNLLKKYTQGQ